MQAMIANPQTDPTEWLEPIYREGCSCMWLFEHAGVASTGRAVLDQCSALWGDRPLRDATPIIVKGGTPGQPR